MEAYKLDVIEWLRKRDPRIIIKPLGADCIGVEWVGVFVPHDCVHLVPDGEKFRCDIHDRRELPKMCAEFPTQANELNPDCGFRFDTP